MEEGEHLDIRPKEQEHTSTPRELRPAKPVWGKGQVGSTGYLGLSLWPIHGAITLFLRAYRDSIWKALLVCS